MRVCSLVPRPKATVIALGTRLVLTQNRALTVTVYLYAWLARSIPVVVGKAYTHHVGKKLYFIA